MTSRCSPPTPEAEVLRLAARVQLEPSHRERLIARLSSPLDWPLLQHLVERHRLAPLVYAHVNALAPDRVPRAALVEWWRRHEHHARRNAQLRDHAARAVSALRRAGIHCLAYKGPVLAEMLYGSVGLRAFDDIDLLIRRRDLAPAKAVLLAQGYAAYYQVDAAAEQAMSGARLQYHAVFKGTDPDHLLELHWKTDPIAPVERDADDWWAKQAFTPEETILASCIHAMRHHGYRLCWLVDIAEQLRQQPSIDWQWILRRAAAIHARRRLAVALLMAADVLEAPLPAAIAPELRADRVAASLAGQLGERLFAADRGQLDARERTRIDLQMCDRARDRVRFGLALVFEPSFHEVVERPLPRALWPLYVPLRLWRLARKYAATRSWRNGRTTLDAPVDGAARPE